MPAAPVKVLRWSPKYALGVHEIDRQHQGWFELVNQLHEALLAGRGTEVLTPLLQEVLLYTRHHFDREERLMAAARYPEMAFHMARHQQLRRHVDAFVERFERGESTMTIELTIFLSAWIQRHTMTVDRQLGEFLNAGKALATER